MLIRFNDVVCGRMQRAGRLDFSRNFCQSVGRSEEILHLPEQLQSLCSGSHCAHVQRVEGRELSDQYQSSECCGATQGQYITRVAADSATEDWAVTDWDKNSSRSCAKAALCKQDYGC
jgi:hypothetical protein